MRRMKKRYISATAVSVLFLFLLGGCGKQFVVDEGDGGSTEDEQLIVVGVSQLGSESVWRTANTASIQETFTRENGYLLIFDNARQKQENQIKAIRSFISQQVDYIVFSPIAESGWDVVLEEAKEAGIPVIGETLRLQDGDGNNIAPYVELSSFDVGKNCGTWVVENWESTGVDLSDLSKVGVIQNTNSVYQADLERIDGFMEGLLEGLEIPVPKGVKAEAAEQHLKGMTPDPEQATKEQKAEAEEAAENELRDQMVLDALAEKMDVKVSQMDVTNFLASIAQQYGMDPSAFINAIIRNGQLGSAVEEVGRSKGLLAGMRAVTFKCEGEVLDLSSFLGDVAEDEEAESVEAASAAAAVADELAQAEDAE